MLSDGALKSTGKTWKELMLLGGALMLVSGVVFIVCYMRAKNEPLSDNMAIKLSGGGFLAGLFVFVGARIGTWWHHR